MVKNMRIVKLMARGNTLLATGITEDDVINIFCNEYGVTVDDILNNVLVTVEQQSFPYRTNNGVKCTVREKIIGSCTVEEYIKEWW